MKMASLRNNIHLHYDAEGDLLELCIGKPTIAFMKELGDDVFERIDEKTGKVKGFVILNFKKRLEKSKSIDIPLPSDM